MLKKIEDMWYLSLYIQIGLLRKCPEEVIFAYQGDSCKDRENSNPGRGNRWLKDPEAQNSTSTQLRHHSPPPCPHTQGQILCVLKASCSPLLQYYHTLLKLLPTCPEPLLATP